MPARNRNRTWLTALIVAGVFFALVRLGLFRPITDSLAKVGLVIAAPLYRMSTALAAIRDAAAGRAIGSPEEIETLRAENARLHAIMAENEALKDAIDYRDRFNDRTVAARVVSRTSLDLFHGLVVDRGSDDGLRVGQPAISGDGVIVGKIARVTPRTATVMLLTETRSRLAVALLDEPGSLGVIEGDRGSSMTINLIPAGATVSPGDLIVTSGLEPGIRRGLLVGTVEKISREPQDPFQKALVVPADAARHPLFVEILLTPVEE